MSVPDLPTGEPNEVVVVGALNADLWVRLPRFPFPGETLQARQLVLQSGGKGGNQAVGLARLGRSTSMVGCIGDDEHGHMVAAQLAHENVRTEHLTIVEAPTGLAVVMAEAGGESTIIIAPGANGRLTPDLVDQAGSELAAAKAVLVQLEVPMDAVARAVASASGLVVLNAAPAAQLPPDLLQDVDVLVVNSVELAQMCGIGAMPAHLDDLAFVAADLIDRTAVVVTLGAGGAAVLSRSGAQVVPAVSVDVTDTTAGGDSFCAAIVDGLLAGQELIAAVRYATRIAALTVQREGAMSSLPTREQVALTGALDDRQASQQHLTLVRPVTPAMTPRAVIIDTDPGIDDATALFMALGHPDVEVLGITTVAGNCDVDTTTVNALALLGLVRRGDIPVAKGSADPLAGPPPVRGAGSHGPDGLGGARPPAIEGMVAQPGDAVDLMLSSLRTNDSPVTLIGIGPVTNLARLCRDHPDALGGVEEIIVMGGSAGTGNHTPYAEFNTWYDPEALQVLVASGVRLKIVGLDVTRAAILDASGLERLPAGPVRDFLLRSHHTYGAALGGPLQTHLTEQHDAAAIAALVAPGIFTFEPVHITVDGSSSRTRGRTTVVPDESGRSSVWFARAHDNDAFVQLLLDSLAACAAAVPDSSILTIARSDHH